MEYTKQLTNILVPYIFEGIKSIYETSKSVCRLNNDRNVNNEISRAIISDTKMEPRNYR